MEEFSTDRGTVKLARPARGVVHTIVSGYACKEIAERIIGWVSRSIEARERPAVFHDWEAASGYDPRVRPMFASWYMRVRSDVSAVHVFTKSKVVSMGVTLVSLASGNSIVAHGERREFEAELARALAAAKHA